MSLSCGVIAILVASQGLLILSGALIFSSYWLDMLDGFSARKLNAQSEFGLQLDSLVDMVSLGVAPAVLAFEYLSEQEVSMAWVWPSVILFAIAGAFRLARFNMLPPKTSSSKDSVGLTITQSGATVILAVLADKVHGDFLPPIAYIPLLLVLSVLMVSTLSFPSASWFFRAGKRSWILIAFLALLLIVFPPFSVWFVAYLIYIVVAAIRALLGR